MIQLSFSNLLISSLICSARFWLLLEFSIVSSVILLSVWIDKDRWFPFKWYKSLIFSNALAIANCSADCWSTSPSVYTSVGMSGVCQWRLQFPSLLRLHFSFHSYRLQSYIPFLRTFPLSRLLLQGETIFCSLLAHRIILLCSFPRVMW
jgi:hypothetical protein